MVVWVREPGYRAPRRVRHAGARANPPRPLRRGGGNHPWRHAVHQGHRHPDCARGFGHGTRGRARHRLQIRRAPPGLRRGYRARAPRSAREQDRGRRAPDARLPARASRVRRIVGEHRRGRPARGAVVGRPA